MVITQGRRHDSHVQEATIPMLRAHQRHCLLPHQRRCLLFRNWAESSSTGAQKSVLMQGKVSMYDIDEALMNSFRTLMRVGWFDGNPANQPFGNLGPSDVCTKEHRELVADVARQGIVLLKNDKSTLPFDQDKISSLAVIGPNANATKEILQFLFVCIDI